MRRAFSAGRVIVCIVAALLAVAPAARAQDVDTATALSRADSVRADSVLEARTSTLAAELRCAVCQGISIQESPSALAREMRAIVKEQLREGKTPDEVKEFFVAAYGEWILLSPRPRGLNLLLYLLPVVLLLGGGAVLMVVVRRWAAVAAPGEPPTD